MTVEQSTGTAARTDVDPTTPAENGSLPLSVVIIAENEEALIGECIESVFAACQSVPAFEVILVDSASTDRTVERAREYPVTILRIPEGHTVSCGAGRYVGDQVARGEVVLHIDSDMTLTETWLPRAIEYLRTNDDVAAVEGCLDDSDQEGVVDVEKVGGVMLYDADALAEVGGFDPFLLGYEDIDVGFQLKTAGYRLVRLPAVSAIHHDEGTIAEPLRRWRQGYYVAPGQTIRRGRTVAFPIADRSRPSIPRSVSGVILAVTPGFGAHAIHKWMDGWMDGCSDNGSSAGGPVCNPINHKRYKRA